MDGHGKERRESEKFIQEYATFRTIRSEGSSDGENMASAEQL